MDYVLIALKNKGCVILGDAPVQSCDFEQLLVDGDYMKIIQFYKKQGVELSYIDFRETTAKIVDGILLREHNTNKGSFGIIVDIGAESAFNGTETRAYKISNYNASVLKEHHNEMHHEYSIYRGALEADVIINLPKPKTHRIAGMTGALKNMIGLNTMKEYLPHHSIGAPGVGDEYPNKSWLKELQSYCQNRVDLLLDKYHNYERQFWSYLLRFVNLLNTVECKITGNRDIVAGCWKGNDTIWRTIIDINRILVFADKDGILRDQPQRKILTIADMIICGQGEGPLRPIPYNMGIILTGMNSIAIDCTIAKLMGIDPDSIPSLVNAGFGEKYTLNNEDVIVSSNIDEFNSGNLEISREIFGKIIMPNGWGK